MAQLNSRSVHQAAAEWRAGLPGAGCVPAHAAGKTEGPRNDGRNLGSEYRWLRGPVQIHTESMKYFDR